MNVRRFLELAKVYVMANLKVEVSSYYLNFIWWILEPVMMMSVFYLVFDVMLNQGTSHFVGFLLVGLVSWNWFSRSVSNSKNSIYDAKGLMLQVCIPKLFFPFVIVCQDSFKHLVVSALLLFFLVFYPTPVSLCWLALPVLLVIQFVLILAVSLLCAAIVPLAPDLRFVISTALELLFFASGIFYDLDGMVSPEYRTLIYINPMAGLIKNYRAILLNDQWPNWEYLSFVAIASFLMLLAIGFVLRKSEHLYPKICQQ